MEKISKILIIDDDPYICKMFERFLTTHGYEVLTSNGFQEGLFLLRSEFFNLIILDVCLLGIDGLSLLSKIKSFSSDTEVIMVTGYWNMETAVQSFKLGAYDCLTKPVELNLLFQVIKKALEKQALEFEKRHLIAQTNFKNLLLESQRDLLESKVIEDDQRIYRLIKRGLFTEKLLEKVIETLPLGAIVIDKEGRVLMCNKVQEVFSELSRDSLLGKNLFQDSLPKDLRPWQEMAKDFLSSKFYKVKIVDQRLEKGRVLSITRSSLMDEKGSPTSFIFLSADITNEKRIEEQIVQSEKMTAIGQLVTTLAHQIRNPLAIIGSATQCCMEKGGGKNGLKKHFEIIYRNVQNANKIISELLDFAKPKRLELEKHDINQLLREICRLIKIDFSKNRIRILKRFDRYLPKILCDKESLNQVFFNLFMNSKQAMLHGGVISIITKYNSFKQTVEIIIKDTGKGIPKEHIPNIFNPYFTTKEKGTGLGLSIVHRMISDHHGQIHPESKEGKGTKMTITLPVQSKNLGFQDLRRENEQNSYRG
jgi:PAS domain S-box-containing protein